MFRRLPLLAFGLVAVFAPTLHADDNRLQLWLFQSTNLAVDANIPPIEKLWRRAAAAGYTHVLLGDSKFAHIDHLQDPRYLANVARVRGIAKSLGLVIVPAVAPIGYSNDLLYNDPNLAEGIPVRDALFIVHDGRATLHADPAVALGKPAYRDDSVELQNGILRIAPHPDNARIFWRVAVSPFRCYHVWAMVKSESASPVPQIVALADDQSLQYENLPVNPTQDWSRVDVVFDSLNHSSVNIYFGVWGRGRGTLWAKDIQIEELGLTNVLRRPGTPCIVRTDSPTAKPLVEGVDYQPIRDPHLGDTPWPGAYQPYHPAPPITTHLPEGTRLRVSWYFPPIIYDEQVCACFEAPKTKDLLARQAALMRAQFGDGPYMFSHDEIRTMGWDQSCLDTHESPGQMLAGNVRYCASLYPNSPLYIWSDMFDPFHNAHENYFLVNGDLAGSWNGLPRNMTILNWNFDKRRQSLKFFADRGNPQIIAGYYDADPRQVTQWLEAARGLPGITGVMYTTWQNNYTNIETFARLVRGFH